MGPWLVSRAAASVPLSPCLVLSNQTRTSSADVHATRSAVTTPGVVGEGGANEFAAERVTRCE
ncbi:hypothetical protein JCM12141A_47240 [Mycolicibacterium hodleri]